jgi:molybdate transport system substrate-binding protein
MNERRTHDGGCMKTVLKIFMIQLITMLFFSTGFAADKTELTISAAASMKDALTQIQTMYAKENPGVSLIFNFGASGSLQQQIENGAPVDIFISAAEKQVNDLEKKKLLLDSSKMTLVENAVVLIVPKDSKLKGDFKLLASHSVKKIALGETKSVPVGQYSLEIIESLGIKDAVLPKAVFAKDVREVLTWVETGNVDAGIVYKTDALISKGKVAVIAEAPKGSHKKVTYPAAIIKDSKNAEAAKKFLAYLKGKKAEVVFTTLGFKTVK